MCKDTPFPDNNQEKQRKNESPHPVTHLTVVAQVLPIGLAVVAPDGLVIVIRSTVQGDTTSGSAHPVESLIVVGFVTGL